MDSSDYSSLEVTFPVPELYSSSPVRKRSRTSSDSSGSTSSDSGGSSGSSSSSSSNSSSSSSSQSPSKPLFTRKVIRLYLLSIWGVEPSCVFLSHINRSHLKNANRDIWRTSKGQYVRAEIVKHRAAFIRSLEAAISKQSVREACEALKSGIRTWLEELRTYAKSVTSGKERKATILELKHRCDGLTYNVALLRFATSPSLQTLKSVRGCLKELWVLRHIDLDL